MAIDRVTITGAGREVSLTGKQWQEATGMLQGELPNKTKIELAKALMETAKAARALKASLLVEIDGVGDYSQSAYRGRRGAFFGTVEAVKDILSDTVPAEDLLAEAEQ